jgi:hypothetical protein
VDLAELRGLGSSDTADVLAEQQERVLRHR